MSHLKECKVKIEASEVDGGVHFELDSKYQQNGGLRFDNEKKDDYFVVTFKLDDDTERGLRFPADANDAIWVTVRSEADGKASCPTARGSVPNIQPLYVTPSGQELVVFNKNADEESLTFRLNFVDAQGNAEKYDPPWENGNGGSPR